MPNGLLFGAVWIRFESKRFENWNSPQHKGGNILETREKFTSPILHDSRHAHQWWQINCQLLQVAISSAKTIPKLTKSSELYNETYNETKPFIIYYYKFINIIYVENVKTKTRSQFLFPLKVRFSPFDGCERVDELWMSDEQQKLQM